MAAVINGIICNSKFSVVVSTAVVAAVLVRYQANTEAITMVLIQNAANSSRSDRKNLKTGFRGPTLSKLCFTASNISLSSTERAVLANVLL